MENFSNEFIKFLLGKKILAEELKEEIYLLFLSDPQKISAILIAATNFLEDSSDNITNLAATTADHFGRVFDIINEKTGTGPQFVENWKSLVFSLDARVLPILIRENLDFINKGNFIKDLIQRMNEEEILKVILQSAINREPTDDTLALIFFLLPTGEKRRNIFPALQNELKKNLPPEHFTKILEDSIWNELSLDDKVQLLLKGNVAGIGDIDELKEVIEILLRQREFENTEKIISRIINNLSSDSEKIRSKSVESLSKILPLFKKNSLTIKTYDYILSLLAQKIEDESELVRDEAFKAIAFKGNTDILPYLLKQLGKKNILMRQSFNDFRIKLIETAGEIGDESVVPELSKILKAKSFLTVLENSDIRLAAVKALAKIKSPDSKNILEYVASNDNREVIKNEAKISLENWDKNISEEEDEEWV